jgi:hypothetical protein
MMISAFKCTPAKTRTAPEAGDAKPASRRSAQAAGTTVTNGIEGNPA